MKKFLILLVILVKVSLGYSQDQLDSLGTKCEKFFKEYPKANLNFYDKTENRSYPYNKLSHLSKKAIKRFLTLYPVEKENNYTYDSVSSAINNTIACLPKNKIGYYESLKKIDAINVYSNPVDRIYFLLAWNDYFSGCIDSDLISTAKEDCEKIANQQIDLVKRANCFITIAKFLKKYQYIPESLQEYFRAMHIYETLNYDLETGDMNYEIACLYVKKNNNYFKKQALYYFEQAANYFFSAHDTVDGYLSLARRDFYITRENLLPNKKGNSLQFIINLYNLNLAENKNSNSDIGPRYFVISAVRNYFMSRIDSSNREITGAYSHAALLCAINDCKDYDVLDIYDAIQGLSFYYANIGKKKAAVYYIDFAIKLASFDERNASLNEQYACKSEILCLLNNYDSSIYFAHKSFDSVDYKYPVFISRNMKLRGFDILSRIYQRAGKMDSAKYYQTLYKGVLADYIGEVDEIKRTKGEYDFTKEKELISNKDAVITQAQYDILSYQALANKLHDSIIIMRDILQKSKHENDSLQHSNSIFSNKNSSLISQNIDLDKNLLQKKNELKSTYWVSGLLIFASLLALGTVFIILRTVIKRRDKKLLDGRILLQDTRDLLNAQSKSRIHNLQNNYEKFLYLCRVKGMVTGKKYALQCARYFRFVLNKWEWDDDKWAVADELKLMYEFLATENVLNKNIEIIENFNGVDPNSTKFESEVFTTILSNSIKHGFKGNVDKKFTFTITLNCSESILCTEISDNGIPGKLEDYISADGKENGLKILKRKIETIAKMRDVTKYTQYPFVIEAVEHVGTSIKFILPYEKIENFNS